MYDTLLKEHIKAFEELSKVVEDYASGIADALVGYYEKTKELKSEALKNEMSFMDDANKLKREYLAQALEYDANYYSQLADLGAEYNRQQAELEKEKAEAQKQMRAEAFGSLVDEALKELELAFRKSLIESQLKELASKGLAGVVTGAVISGVVTALFQLGKAQLKAMFGMQDGGIVKQLSAQESGIDNAWRALTPGEMVIKKEMVKQYYPVLQEINMGTYNQENNKNNQATYNKNNYNDTHQVLIKLAQHEDAIHKIEQEKIVENNKELISQVVVTNKKLDVVNERLHSLENAEQRRKIDIRADVKGDPNGIIKAMKFYNYQRSFI